MPVLREFTRRERLPANSHPRRVRLRRPRPGAEAEAEVAVAVPMTPHILLPKMFTVTRPHPDFQKKAHRHRLRRPKPATTTPGVTLGVV